MTLQQADLQLRSRLARYSASGGQQHRLSYNPFERYQASIDLHCNYAYDTQTTDFSIDFAQTHNAQVAFGCSGAFLKRMIVIVRLPEIALSNEATLATYTDGAGSAFLGDEVVMRLGDRMGSQGVVKTYPLYQDVLCSLVKQSGQTERLVPHLRCATSSVNATHNTFYIPLVFWFNETQQTPFRATEGMAHLSFNATHPKNLIQSNGDDRTSASPVSQVVDCTLICEYVTVASSPALAPLCRMYKHVMTNSFPVAAEQGEGRFSLSRCGLIAYMLVVVEDGQWRSLANLHRAFARYPTQEAPVKYLRLTFDGLSRLEGPGEHFTHIMPMLYADCVPDQNIYYLPFSSSISETTPSVWLDSDAFSNCELALQLQAPFNECTVRVFTVSWRMFA